MCKKENLMIALIAVILIALTVFGSFWDYEIANAVYMGEMPSENLFGILFAFIGIMPTFVGWSFLGASIFCLSKSPELQKTKKRWLTALSVLLFILSFFYFCNTLMMVNSNAFSVHWAVAYPIGIAIILAVGYLGYRLSERSKNPELLKSVLVLAAVSIITMIIIMSTKGIMNRPRFRFVLDASNESYFRNWWQSGKDIRSSLFGNAVTDEFSSFPSGHSAYSMFAIFLFPALADYIPKLQKFKALLFFFGFLWWGLTAFSRLSVGAHYLTDVSIAGLVTILAYAVVTAFKHFASKQKK